VSKRLAKGHDGKAGVYGAVIVEGVIKVGDEITLLD
jgi:MOSC domain-containing protein YiiM